jgi:hypothetical protein
MDDRQKIVKVLGPAAAVGVAVLLVGALIAINQMPPDTGKRTLEPESSATPPPPPGPSKLPFPADAPDWKPMDNGMKTWDVTPGTGAECPPGAKLTIHYTGWLPDGTVFDSSKKRGQPATFSLGGLIPGWQAGIPGMKVGGTRRLFIPPELGYGSSGTGGIPPNSDLYFEVELIALP